MGKRQMRGIEMPVALVAIVSLLAAGCSKRSTLPETYPVRGKVVFQGGQPVRGGSVQFRPQEDARVSANGEIHPDGTFTLYSFAAGGHSSGAIAGPHRVTVTAVLEGRPPRVIASPYPRMAPASGGRSATPSIPTITVPDTVTVTLPDVYVVQPKDNSFTITVNQGIN